MFVYFSGHGAPDAETGTTYLVPFDGSFRVDDAPTGPPEGEDKKKKNKDDLATSIKRMRKLQRKLYADDRYAVLLVFQAMDAAGKDGTIRAVMSGVNPAGCQVYSFKQPSEEELDHDFLWRSSVRLPERGRIGVFNRSYYEEVLVVRVHPEYLGAQRLPNPCDFETFWDQRFESRPSFNHKANLPDTLVVEFKFDRDLQPIASKLLQGFPLRVSRHSKYVNAALAIQNY